MPVFVRLNVKHGPNVEELLQEIPHGANRLYLEFDWGIATCMRPALKMFGLI